MEEELAGSLGATCRLQNEMSEQRRSLFQIRRALKADWWGQERSVGQGSYKEGCNFHSVNSRVWNLEIRSGIGTDRTSP